jgi:hypothetical protein
MNLSISHRRHRLIGHGHQNSMAQSPLPEPPQAVPADSTSVNSSEQLAAYGNRCPCAH